MTKARVQPISPALIGNLVRLAKAFAEAAEIKITTVGTNSTKTASFYLDLESGDTSCTLRKYDLLTAWFEENWPEGHTMPTLEDPQHYKTPEGKLHVEKATVRSKAAKGRKESRSTKGAKGRKKESRRGTAKGRRS